VGQAFVYSLTPGFDDPPGWFTFNHYLNLWEDVTFLESLYNTSLFTVVTIPAELIIGLTIAVMLNKKFRFRGLVRVAILFPWALPTALNAIMWRWMFNSEFGIINALLMQVGMLESPLNWLGKDPLAMIAMMCISTWKTSSFMALLLLAGLQTIPDDLYEAGKIDGATGWKAFRYITLPLIKPAIMVALLLRTMDAFRVFELPFNLTDGGPANSTETVSLYAYRVIFDFVEFNYGSSIVIVQFLIIMAMSLIYIRSIKGETY
ncbi:MAG TPA: ABC transporter permease, partial [Dehalococcoidia bacterium]|nr:ABC transporter permease [Dehalococcoidia bacterium]